MNLSKAKKIVESGVIPGTFDSVDVAEAKGFIEGVNSVAVLQHSHDILQQGYEKLIILCQPRLQYGSVEELKLEILKIIIQTNADSKEALGQPSSEKEGD